MEESKLTSIAKRLRELADEVVVLESELKGAVETDKVYPVIAQLIGSRPKDR
jgi:hypothetical protein